MTRTVSYIDKDIITLRDCQIPYHLVFWILLLKKQKIYSNNKNAFNSIILDFSQIKYIDPEGALALICFCSAIAKNENVIFHFVQPTESVLNYLKALGFFGQMSNKVGVIEIQDIVHYENELRHERRIRQKYSNQINLKSIIYQLKQYFNKWIL